MTEWYSLRLNVSFHFVFILFFSLFCPFLRFMCALWENAQVPLTFRWCCLVAIPYFQMAADHMMLLETRDLNHIESGYSWGLRLSYFLGFFLPPIRMTHSPTDADLQPARCCNSEGKLCANTATLFATDPIRSRIDPVLHVFLSPRFPLFILSFIFSSSPFDEWLCFLGQKTALWLIMCSLFHLLTSFFYFNFYF